MSERPPSLARMPSDASLTPPLPGAWCRACHGTRWWTERHGPRGWCCLTCHPPDHLPADAIRREGQGPSLPAPARDPAEDPLFRQAGVALDDG
jgi:hypothetical protein